MSLEIINVMFKSLPNILDSISAQLRQEADKKYKCSLQSKDYKNEECNDNFTLLYYILLIIEVVHRIKLRHT